MGQKVHPIGFRLGVIRTWSSVWYAGKGYADLLHEDIKLRDYVKKRLKQTGVAKIDIERAGSKAKVHIFTARPSAVGTPMPLCRLHLVELLSNFSSCNGIPASPDRSGSSRHLPNITEQGHSLGAAFSLRLGARRHTRKWLLCFSLRP